MRITRSFNRLLPTTIKELKKMGVIFLILSVALLMIGLANSKLGNLLKIKESIASSLVSEQATITKLRKEVEIKEAKLETSDIMTSKLVDKGDFTKFLGRSAEVTNVSIVDLRGGDLTSTDSISAINFRFELSGNIKSVLAILSEIDNLGSTYNVRQMSLRKEGEFKWLNRNLSPKANNWFDIDTKSSGMPTQNIPLPSSLPEIVLNQKGEIIEIKDSRLTGTEDLLSGERISIYLDISFLLVR